MTRTGIAATALCPELGADEVVEDNVSGVVEVGTEREREDEPGVAIVARCEGGIVSGYRPVTADNL